MPLVRLDDAPSEAFGDTKEVFLSDGGGLTQFGAVHVTLGPDDFTSIPHWHSDEDEFVYMLTGEASVLEGADTYTIRPGESVCFKAGDAREHTIRNTGAEPVTFLVVGTRARQDTVTYPLHDRMLHRDRDAEEDRWTTIGGDPASNPYRDL